MSPPLLSFPRASKRALLAPSQITQSISSEREAKRRGGESKKEQAVKGGEERNSSRGKGGGAREGSGVGGGEKDLRRIEATETVQDSIGVNTHSGRKGGHWAETTREMKGSADRWYYSRTHSTWYDNTGSTGVGTQTHTLHTEFTEHTELPLVPPVTLLQPNKCLTCSKTTGSSPLCSSCSTFYLQAVGRDNIRRVHSRFRARNDL